MGSWERCDSQQSKLTIPVNISPESFFIGFVSSMHDQFFAVRVILGRRPGGVQKNSFGVKRKSIYKKIILGSL